MSGVLAAPSTGSSCGRLLAVLESESAALFGNRERIEAACGVLRDERDRLAEPVFAPRLQALARSVSRRLGAGSAPIADLLCDVAAAAPDPWEILEGLFDSNDARIVSSALASLARAAAADPSVLGDRVLAGLAARADGGGVFAQRATLETIAALLRAPPARKEWGPEALFESAAAPRVRRLAARILDLGPVLPSAGLIRRVLGPEASAWFAPYLAWTRAKHADLLALATGAPAATLESLRFAESVCGRKLLREMIGGIGWPRLNFGVSVRRCLGVRIGGSFPLLIDAAEAPLFESFPAASRAFERLLITAHGGLAAEPPASQQPAIARFREYNLAHAELLAHFLDVAPLTVGRVRDVVERMDRIVADFQGLFDAHTDECPLLAAVYASLRDAVERALAGESGAAGKPLSAELTRLVTMFEDPGSLSAVRTLHGLKRYLHQRGLKLGMRLAETGGGANRTVALALATPERVLRTEHAVEYADFEPGGVGESDLPYPVRAVVEEFERQLLHAMQPLPKVKVFCYGNEVHYFIAYRNHPAFVRIDYSPPGRGGMIDLEYFGVSKYEIGSHPDPSLPALGRFFRSIDFDVRIDATRVQARYDKERAFDLRDLCEKARALFRLTPYLMDLDWVIGDLALGSAAREEVASSWAAFFASWGVLPYLQFITQDRRGILAALESDATGVRELRWTGFEPYRDRFSAGISRELVDHLRTKLAARGLEPVLRIDALGEPAQLAVEDAVLRPLRDAGARGEIVAVAGGFVPGNPALFERRHPAECLTRIQIYGEEALARAARVADLAAQLARGLRFRTVGAIDGYDVQSASLPLADCTVGLHVLRDASGIFRLGIWSTGDSLFASRDDARLPWRENWSADSEALATMVRRANYPAALREAPPLETEQIIAAFRNPNPSVAPPPLRGERLLAGVAASPGRAVGLARLGLANRRPADVEGAVVVCPSMTPEDGVFLRSCAGVVSTGGGALSHAGLLALQYGKPALIVKAAWMSGGSLPALAYRAVRFEESRREIGGRLVTERRDVRERDERLCDGDLVVVDSDEGVLRVLGQEPATLALHESLRQLELATAQLDTARMDREILVARGRQLRARHQLEKVIARLADPVLARHAVAELLLRDGERGIAAAGKRALLARLLGNVAIAPAARDSIAAVAETVRRRAASAMERARLSIPDARASWEVLSLRLEALRLGRTLDSIRELIAGTGIEVTSLAPQTSDLDDLARRRLERIREDHLGDAELAAASADLARMRLLVEQIDRTGRALGIDSMPDTGVARLRASVEDHDRVLLRCLSRRCILDATVGGLELRSLAGSKAANLAQAARLGEGDRVPPWFVVTDVAFRRALDSPVFEPARAAQPPRSVGAAIAAILERPDVANDQKASLIREVWEAARLPATLADQVTRAYRRLGGSEDAFVAVRSSAREEDLEAAARAGEFDTFLFVRGEESLLAHLKRAWAGLWTERALHSRAILETGGEVGGGILVQKMVSARASGVLHTVNVAERRMREMVINAGLGLGEGIVSGAVAADTIIVAKEDDLAGALHFRYLTADKRQRVVFNSRVGSGTALVETLHHQRLRPALEYVEICELVRAAGRLEAAYGYPLDIEFAVEGTAVFLLQVRPIPTPFAVWRETAERWPLGREDRAEPFRGNGRAGAGEVE